MNSWANAMDLDSKLDSPKMGVGPPNPLEISVIIDCICLFLPREDLAQLRLVSHEWNLSCIRILRNVPNYSHINLIQEESESEQEDDEDDDETQGHVQKANKEKNICEYIKFLDSRDEAVDWYANYIKYTLRLWFLTSEQEFQSAETLMERFGPACLQSLNIELRQEVEQDGDTNEGVAKMDLDSLCTRIEKIISGAKLTSLELILNCVLVRVRAEDLDRNGDFHPLGHVIDWLGRILNALHSLEYLDVMILIPAHASQFDRLNDIEKWALERLDSLVEKEKLTGKFPKLETSRSVVYLFYVS